MIRGLLHDCFAPEIPGLFAFRGLPAFFYVLAVGKKPGRRKLIREHSIPIDFSLNPFVSGI